MATFKIYFENFYDGTTVANGSTVNLYPGTVNQSSPSGLLDSKTTVNSEITTTVLTTGIEYAAQIITGGLPNRWSYFIIPAGSANVTAPVLPASTVVPSVDVWGGILLDMAGGTWNNSSGNIPFAIATVGEIASNGTVTLAWVNGANNHTNGNLQVTLPPNFRTSSANLQVEIWASVSAFVSSGTNPSADGMFQVNINTPDISAEWNLTNNLYYQNSAIVPTVGYAGAYAATYATDVNSNFNPLNVQVTLSDLTSMIPTNNILQATITVRIMPI